MTDPNLDSSTKPELENDNAEMASEWAAEPYNHHVWRASGVGHYAGDNPHPLSNITQGRREDVLTSVEEKFGKEVADKLNNGEYVSLKEHDGPHAPEVSVILGTSSLILEEFQHLYDSPGDHDMDGEMEIDDTPYLTEDDDFHNEMGAGDDW